MEKHRNAIMKDLGTVMEDAEALIAATADVAGDKVLEARKRLASSLEMGKEAFEQVRERAFDQVEALEEKVRANPIAAIGIALGVGAFIGMLLLGRRSRRG